MDSSAETGRNSHSEAVPANEQVLQRQTEGFRFALQTLLERSGNNPELIEDVNNFLRALQTRVSLGSNEEQLSPQQVESLREELRFVAAKLRHDMGGTIEDAKSVQEYFQKNAK